MYRERIIGFPIVELGVLPIKTKMLLKIPNFWKTAIKHVKNPIIKEKSNSFLQLSFFIIKKAKTQKSTIKKKLTNPAPLSGLPHKLLETSRENIVEIKVAIKKAKSDTKGKKVFVFGFKAFFIF